MSTTVVRPGRASGTVRPPSSKSYTHRAVVVGHLAGRPFVIERPLRSADTLRTLAAVRALGSSVAVARDRWTVSPRRRAPGATVRIDCGESGTTLRFAAALAARGSGSVTLRGRGRLPMRPMRSLVAALRERGATVTLPPGPRSLPMTVRGPLSAGTATVDASESSQFVSALLLVAPTLGGATRVRLPAAPVSAPYIDATIAVLRAHGIRLTVGAREYRIPGRQPYLGDRFVVPGDASSAAYLWSAAAVSGGEVTVRGLPDRWPQADLAVLDLLVRVGATVVRGTDGTTVRGTGVRPFRVDLDDAPDLYPLAGVLGACADGTSELVGAAHVVAKESDRRAETIRLVRALGAAVAVRGASVRIRGTGRPTRFVFAGSSDHRLVMSAAVGALAADGPCRVGDPHAVAKSYPGFWTTLESLVRGGRR